MSTILFAGGGSIGHIAPSVAVAKFIEKEFLRADVHFVCGPRKEEKEYIEKEGYACTSLEAPRLSLTFPWRFAQALRAARKILKRVQPDLVFSKGGYVSVPLCMAAKRLKIPIVLHESDAVSGNANKIVARFAEYICHGFPQAEGSQLRAHSYTGNPIRPGIDQGSEEKGRTITGFHGSKPVLMVLGGSQGALAINQIIAKHLPELLKICDVIHLTGHGKSTVEGSPKGYFARPFVLEELPHLYAITDVALSRAGAGSIAELAANAIPTILVPLRGVAHDHQEKNALAAAKSGGCYAVGQTQLDKKLLPMVKELMADPATRKRMGGAIRSLHVPSATGQIAKIITKCLADHRRAE